MGCEQVSTEGVWNRLVRKGCGTGKNGRGGNKIVGKGCGTG